MTRLRPVLLRVAPACTESFSVRGSLTAPYNTYMTRVEELRQKYPVFRYERFQIDRTSSRVTVRFHFSIPPDFTFLPEIHFESIRDGWHDIPEEFLHNAIFHLGLIESFSYWKATASPVIEVLAGAMTADQIRWWEDLLIHGMGEFFYRND